MRIPALTAQKRQHAAMRRLRGEFNGTVKMQRQSAFPLSEGFKAKGYYMNDRGEKVTV